MERVKILALIVAVVMVMAIAVTDAQGICNMPASGLMACKPAVTPPNPPPPTSTCCSSLSHADMRCLCSYKNSKLLPSLGIDPNLAMQLPSLCKLPNPAKC
ncbi:putative lipid-transfer protein DIR1 [Durio zibethinus]|uniref:Lipid-transfer protein DIR1 n=1 Tax=Durio zibethinus TaxID=66656 RepID=A0A6P6A880_DURZI|nr:putative lipid-transfer protein DIR1 [Durio zibethinus]